MASTACFPSNSMYIQLTTLCLKILMANTYLQQLIFKYYAVESYLKRLQDRTKCENITDTSYWNQLASSKFVETRKQVQMCKFPKVLVCNNVYSSSKYVAYNIRLIHNIGLRIHFYPFPQKYNINTKEAHNPHTKANQLEPHP